MRKYLHSFATLSVAVAGVVIGSPFVNLIPSATAKTVVLGVASAILAANGAVVANGHKD